MILLTFALPHESGKFLGSLENPNWVQRGTLPVIRGRFAGIEVVLLHTGMGPERAKARCVEFLARSSPEMIVAAGYGGGLDEQLAAGDLLIADNFSDPDLVSFAREAIGGRAVIGKLTTQKQVAETPEAKRRLARQTGAIAVDMETEAIREQAVRFHIPMLAIRAISDPLEVGMPIPGEIWFDQVRQKPRIVHLLAYLGRHPSKIPSFARFARSASLARNELAFFLAAILLASRENLAVAG